MGFKYFGFPLTCHSSYGDSDFFPGRTSSCWTRQPWLDAHPYMIVSHHTALHVPCKLPSLHKLLVHPISGWHIIYFEHVSTFAPSPLQRLHHYYELIRPCALYRYSDSYGFSPLESLPLHQDDRFPSSTQMPKLSSCCLYAGRWTGSNRISPELIPEKTRIPWF